MRILALDYYMAPPHELMDRTTTQFAPVNPAAPPHVPIVRIFGATPHGQKCCLRIHQAYPYVFLPYNGSVEPAALQRNIYTAGAAINGALFAAYNRPKNRTVYVSSILLVKGIPYYGLHTGFAYFLKVHLLNPGHVTKFAELVRSGQFADIADMICNEVRGRMEVFESHIPFLLQFLLDYNLSGMAMIQFKDIKFRHSLPDAARLTPDPPSPHDPVHQPYYWTRRSTPAAMQWPLSLPIPKQSYCELEVDGWCSDILNRLEIPERTHAPISLKGKARAGPAPHSPGPRSARLVKSMRRVWDDEAARRESLGLPPLGPPTISPTMPRVREEWDNELALYEALTKRIDDKLEQDAASSSQGDSQNGQKKVSAAVPHADDNVLTVFTAVGSLFPDIAHDGSDGEPTPVPDSVLPPPGTLSIDSEPNRKPVRLALTQREAIGLLSQEEAERLSGHSPPNFAEDGSPRLDLDPVLMEMDRDGDMDHGAEGGALVEDLVHERHHLEDCDESRHVAILVDQLLPLGREERESSVDGLGSSEDEDPAALTTDELVLLQEIERQVIQQVDAEMEWKEQHDFDQQFFAREDAAQPEANELTRPHNLTMDGTSDGLGDLNDIASQIFTSPNLSQQSSARLSASHYGSSPLVTPSKPGPRFQAAFLGSQLLAPDHSTDDEGDNSDDGRASDLPAQPKYLASQLLVPENSIDDEGDDGDNGRASDLLAQPTYLASQLLVPEHSTVDEGDDGDDWRTSDLLAQVGTLPAAMYPASQLLGPENGSVDKDADDGDGCASALPPASPKKEPPSTPESTRLRIPQFDGAGDQEQPPLPAEHPPPAPTPAQSEAPQPTFLDNLGGLWSSSEDEDVLDARRRTGQPLRDLVKPPKQPKPPPRWSFFHDPPSAFSPSPVPGPQPPVPSIVVLPPPSSPLADGIPSHQGHQAQTSPRPGPSNPNKRKALQSPGETDEPVSVSGHEPSAHEESPISVSDSCDIAPSSKNLALKGPSSTSVHSSPLPSSPTPVDDCYRPRFPPPTSADLLSTLNQHGIPRVVYQEPYFSDPLDVPKRPMTFAGREFKLQGASIQLAPQVSQLPKDYVPPRHRVWTPADPPPARSAILNWLKEHPPARPAPLPPRAKSQISLPTPQTPHGFKYTAVRSEKLLVQKEWMSILSVEIIVCTRGKLKADPLLDPVRGIVWCLVRDGGYPSNGRRQGYEVGAIMVKSQFPLTKAGIYGYHITTVDKEQDLFQELSNKVRDWDVDVLCGWEIHSGSLGYVIERAAFVFDFDLLDALSRVHTLSKKKFGKDQDSYGFNTTSSISVSGRIVLNVWRLMKGELNSTSYTLENCVWHVLRQRIPRYSDETLTAWFEGPSLVHKWKTLKYYFDRVQHNVELLDDTDLIARTSEFARIFGIDFFSVLSRGSQYRVESVMLRIAKPENYVMISAGSQQIGKMRAAEALPLVMEPESGFYNSPLLVLDFQSLYPSIMIAYNYCYSTCLGRVTNLNGPTKFGVTGLNLDAEFLDLYRDQIHISPNGVYFIKPHVREGVLGRMLRELLETRVMVKKSMKLYADDKALLKILNARQLGLKLLANVTYGYAGASFSGRMPCVDIADAIVQTGREILEKSINFINAHPKWNAKVVYGDTDSVFVYLPGTSHDDAFRVGQEMVDVITAKNPTPITLKFEKVYHPCVLLAKKRYVGWKFEHAHEKEGTFDAKGIETVRRDGCPAVAKIMENSLKLLFRSPDLSILKAFLTRQFERILTGRSSTPDFIIAKAVKLGTYSSRGLPPPGAYLSLERMRTDKRAEPQYGERVPYVVIHSGPKARLIDCVVSPEELVENPTLRLHGTYYIEKQIIPPLARVFNLLGADIKSWYADMPKIHRAIDFTSSQRVISHDAHGGGRIKTIDQFYSSTKCLICDAISQNDFCPNCLADKPSSLLILQGRQSTLEAKYRAHLRICKSCTNIQSPIEGIDVPCISLDCSNFYTRKRAQHDVKLSSTSTAHFLSSSAGE